MAIDDDILDVEVEILDPVTDTPLAQQDAKFTRRSLLLAPDWRYQDAVEYLAAEREGRAVTLPSDPLVQFTIRALRAHRKQDTNSFLMQLWPDMYTVLYYGTVAQHSAMVSDMETFLLHDRTPSDIINAGLPCGPVIYELYGKIFFDLSGAIAVHSWINDFLFEPERYKEHTGRLRSRLLAYYGSVEVGMKSSITAASSTEADNLMKRLMGNERNKKIFDYVLKHSQLKGIEYAMLMESALKGMTDREFAEHMKDRADAGSSSLESLAENLEEGIRAFTAHEMDRAGDSSMDFVNRYTTVILNNSKDTSDERTEDVND